MALFDKNLVSYDEVLVLTGVDLKTIQDDANPSNKVERFIYEAQTTLASFLMRNYKNDLYIWYNHYLNDEQREHIKMAIALQCKYMVLNGNIGEDSLEERPNARKVSPNAIDELGYCRGLCVNTLDKTDWLSRLFEVDIFGGY